MSESIDKHKYPVGSRLLVALRIRAHDPAIVLQETLWVESEQVCEIEVAEYSPSGNHVRVISPASENRMHDPTTGWYPIFRIVVKEVLEKRG